SPHVAVADPIRLASGVLQLRREPAVQDHAPILVEEALDSGIGSGAFVFHGPVSSAAASGDERGFAPRLALGRAVAAAELVLIHALVGDVEEGLAVGAVLREHGDADAGPDFDAVADPRDRLDGAAHALGDALGLLL